MKGRSLEELLNKRIKLTTYSGNKYVGQVIGYVPSQDNELRVEEINIKNELDNKNYALFENEILSLEIIE